MRTQFADINAVERMPCARLENFEAYGHFAFLKDSEHWKDVVTAFLKE